MILFFLRFEDSQMILKNFFSWFIVFMIGNPLHYSLDGLISNHNV